MPWGTVLMFVRLEMCSFAPARPPRFFDFHGIPWNSMEYHGIPWNTMEYHGQFRQFLRDLKAMSITVFMLWWLNDLGPLRNA
eukprot:s1740_g11.t1